MTKLQFWTVAIIISAIISLVGMAVFPPVGFIGSIVTILIGLWTVAVYEEETRLF